MSEESREAGAETGVFVARPLPRLRAWMALIFLATALLAVGGAIEFATGSPMTEGQGVSTYFAVVFALHAVAFGGAAMIGAFPALARRWLKLPWLAAVAALYLLAFFIWRAHAEPAESSMWFGLSAHFAPALLPLVAGALWASDSVAVEDVRGEAHDDFEGGSQ